MQAGQPSRVGLRSAVVINPSKVADLDAARRELCEALDEAGWPPPLWLETTVEDPGCGQTRDAVAAGVDVVFASGGDGTVMACASVLAGTDVALAVVPAGTGNLLAANLGLPADVRVAVTVATSGVRRRIDVGAVDDLCFTIMAGMGFDAQMMDDADDVLKARIGWPAYVLSALRHLRDQPMSVSVRLDGGAPLRRRARTVLIANLGRLQGGVTLFPRADPADGVLDVAIIAPRTLRHWLTMAWHVMLGKERVARMETFRARQVEVTSDRDQPRELDGDVITPGRSLAVQIRPAALLLCVPPGAI
jgi:YegS/Rv2252/BmrU family lipid kinase